MERDLTEPVVESLLPLSLRLPSALGSMPSLHFFNINSLASATLRLYRDDGSLDDEAAARLDLLLADTSRPGKPPEVAPIDRRLLRLLFRVAYHFNITEVELVSGFRKPRRFAEGLHGKARAIDFRLVGVDAPLVAAYLRGVPRVGVGLYTHPRTRWVHLDVRDRSYHWADATPPGKRWGAAPMTMDHRALDELDSGYEQGDDLPE